LNTQKAEANALRQNASSAANLAMQADVEAAARLETCLNEGRVQAAQDRNNLLAQITDLVNKSSETQEARWESKINAVRDDIVASRCSFQAADEQYNEGMDVWSQKESLVVEEVLKSRDTLKGKMKKDWTAVNEHNMSIQTTTKSVHEETIRIVDAQMKDMAIQMQALDDFVTRARSQNERHHGRHVESLQSLASTVHQSYTSIGDHFVSTYDRVRDLGTDVSERTSTLQASLPELTTSIQQPLSELRHNIEEAPLQEYASTGETPQKTQYQFPTTLPRTESHDKLLAKLNRPHHNLTSPHESPAKSPSKPVVYTDTPVLSEDITMTDHTENPRPATAPGLREIDMNVSRHSEPSSLLSSSKPDVKLENMGMGPPPMKRQATIESKLPKSLGGKAGQVGVLRLEGRENLGAGRRLRSSPSGL